MPLDSPCEVNVPRTHFALVTLADGRLLATGGFNATNSALASAELYTPSSNTWVLTPPMSLPRTSHAGLLLADAGVLALGGTDGTRIFTSVDAYNVMNNSWTPITPNVAMK